MAALNKYLIYPSSTQATIPMDVNCRKFHITAFGLKNSVNDTISYEWNIPLYTLVCVHNQTLHILLELYTCYR